MSVIIFPNLLSNLKIKMEEEEGGEWQDTCGAT